MTNRICHIEIDESGLKTATPEIEQERRVAVFDLLEDNRFGLPAREERAVPAGPYRLALAIREGRLVFDIATEAGDRVGEFHLSLGPFRQVVKDYFQICESYFEAVKRLPPSQIGRSTWPGAASITKVPASCRSGWRGRPKWIPIRPAACSP